MVYRLPDAMTGTAAIARYPLLIAIDRARGDGPAPFSTDLAAALLEVEARRLTGLYWSELALLTGSVPTAAFKRVCTELEHIRGAAAGDTGRRHEPAA